MSGSLGENGRYVNYYFGENYDYRIQVDRGMAQVTIRPAGTPFYFYNVYSTIKQIESKYIPFVQPDWEEQDTESAAYIKNKPDYYTDEGVNIKVNNGEYALTPYSYSGMGNITMRFFNLTVSGISNTNENAHFCISSGNSSTYKKLPLGEIKWFSADYTSCLVLNIKRSVDSRGTRSYFADFHLKVTDANGDIVYSNYDSLSGSGDYLYFIFDVDDTALGLPNETGSVYY